MSEILFEIRKQVAYISLNSPKTYNSLTFPMGDAFIDSLEKCEEETIRAVVISGTGKAFCAGQDLKEIAENKDLGFGPFVEKKFNPIIRAIRSLEKPVIACVNGVAAGAGANIALACDIVLAKYSASFIQAFSKIGLVPDSGGSYILPRLIGYQRAMGQIMLGDKITAQQAQEMGMIYKAIPDEDFDDQCEKIINTLANMPTKALAYTKKLLQESMNNSLEEQLDLEKKYQVISGNTEDCQEGMTAFFEKRKPNFTGK